MHTAVKDSVMHCTCKVKDSEIHSAHIVHYIEEAECPLYFKTVNKQSAHCSLG